MRMFLGEYLLQLQLMPAVQLLSRLTGGEAEGTAFSHPEPAAGCGHLDRSGVCVPRKEGK
ncbi:MAG: hypothetical protein AB9917_09405 [Negativicutes bacterium]